MSKTQYTQTQKNAMVGVMLSAIVVIGNYFLWIKSLFDALHMTIGFRIAYFIIGFFVCLGFASLLFNFNSAMANLADNKK